MTHHTIRYRNLSFKPPIFNFSKWFTYGTYQGICR